jgi:hypothetical protein
MVIAARPDGQLKDHPLPKPLRGRDEPAAADVPAVDADADSGELLLICHAFLMGRGREPTIICY